MKKTIFILLVCLIAVLFIGNNYLAKATPADISGQTTANGVPYDNKYGLKYVFDDYKIWPKSKYIDDSNWISILDLLGQIVKTTPNMVSYGNWVDINGDGLSDLLYYYNTCYAGYPDACYSGGIRVQSAVFMNKGNNELELAYKCVEDRGEVDNPYDGFWYGDCAGNTEKNGPDIFTYNYPNSLPFSTGLKEDDLMYHSLYFFAQSGNMVSVGVGNGQYAFSDMNGDGILDFVYASYSYNTYEEKVYPHVVVLQNTGSNKFEPVYECHYSGNPWNGWHGDCGVGN